MSLLQRIIEATRNKESNIHDSGGNPWAGEPEYTVTWCNDKGNEIDNQRFINRYDAINAGFAHLGVLLVLTSKNHYFKLVNHRRPVEEVFVGSTNMLQKRVS